MALIIPKNNADEQTLDATLKIYYDVNDWVENSYLIDHLSSALDDLGKEEVKKEPQSYTKKTQVLAYYGFITWEDVTNAQSRRKITDLGKRFYEARQKGIPSGIFDVIIESLNKCTFGRNVIGCNSDSDLEPPNIFLKSALLLDGINLNEFAYILQRMEFDKVELADAIFDVSLKRKMGQSVNPNDLAAKWKDPKPILALGNWGLFFVNKTNGLNHYYLNKDVISTYSKDLMALRTKNTDTIRFKMNVNDDMNENKITGRQIIYYGAPGTGKSHEISKQTEGEAVVRTTFHPDSDYSTFVGAYKPTMDYVDSRVVPVVLGESGTVFEKNVGTYKEKRIVYRFVKQAFLKAYLGAWKKYTDGNSICYTPAVYEFKTDNGRYIINSVGDYDLTLSREFKFPKSLVLSEWSNLWNNGVFEVPKGPQTGKSVQHAIAIWIFNKIENCSKDSFEEGWNKLFETVKQKKHVDVQKTQTYIIRDVADDNETLTINVEARCKKRITLQRKFNETDKVKSSKLEKRLIEILRRYNSDFDEAWEILKQEINKGITPEVKDESDGQIDPQFLVIEEINRGNCAQIFGDIFQLLDRADNGFSVYPIEADSDLRDAIKDAFKEEEEFKLSNNIDIDGLIEYTSNYGATLSEDVQEGRVLLLPPNLYIWATMNTSDQSLFPIDSAFKRRWDWVYMPIGYKNNWTIEIGNKKYNWVEFQHKINESIYAVDNSEDKQLGDYFVNADITSGKISAETLLNKILFYIWNDVCKDDPDQIFRWIDDNQEKSIKFSEFFGKDRDKKLQGFMAFHKIPDSSESTGTNDSGDKQDSGASDTDNNPAEKNNDVNS